MNTFKNKYMVYVPCITYNQARFIKDAMDGFCKQETSFPFICVIIDDASTDGEPEVVRRYFEDNFELDDASIAYENDVEYGHILFAQHKTNRNCFFAALFLRENHYCQNKSKDPYTAEWRDNSKYIAECEGDDYWSDPLKLQKQVGFLEAHEDYGFVGSHCIIDKNGSQIEEKSNIPYVEVDKDFLLCGDVFSDAKWGPVTRTCTLVYRKSLIDGYSDDVIGDIVLETVLAKYSYYACYNSFASVYRTGVGVSSVKHDFDKALRYNEYLVKSRLKQKELFPVDCPWDENELYDSTTYIKLKHSIELFKYLDAMRLKKQLKTNLYKNKNYAKRMKGFFSFVILFFMIKLKG